MTPQAKALLEVIDQIAFSCEDIFDKTTREPYRNRARKIRRLCGEMRAIVRANHDSQAGWK